jgi:thymidine phosphorylase
VCECYFLQGKQVLSAGIGRASEVEEEVDPIKARQYLQEPSSLLQLPSTLIQDMTK